MSEKCPALAGQSYKTSLSILPEQAPLRRGAGVPGANAFLDAMTWPPTSEADPPRALRGLAQIVDGGLCHRCGSCVGTCPTGVLGLDKQEFPYVKSLSACTDCDLCVRVCPGDRFDFKQANQELFGADGDLESTHGTFSRAVIAYAADIAVREKSTSGGLVTAMLLHLLESGSIDGAIVIASDQERIWKGRPIVARTADELKAAAKSKYAISPTNAVFAEVREMPGRYALVGLPCQIHGFRKAARLDQRIRERVVLTIGLFCHAAIEHEAFEVMWSGLEPRREKAVRFTSRVGKHPGTPYLELEDGTHSPLYFPDKRAYRPSSMEMINILYRLYTPDRCLTCFDALAEFADIAIGDPWLAPPEDDVNFYDGWSFALMRTACGQEAYQRCLDAGRIVGKELTRRGALSCNVLMATEKRWRAFRVMETHRRQGKPIPQYTAHDLQFPRHRGLQFAKTELHMLTHIFCFLPRYRARLLKFFLGEGGYRLLWLNNFRRTFRFWRRDILAKARRKLLGRT